MTGIVRDGSTHAPISNANVFLRGELTGAFSDSAGRFTISLRHHAIDTVMVRRVGYRDTAVVVNEAPASLTIELMAESTRLESVVVSAGRYSASDEPGAVLTPLEIVTIPGTAADVNRAIQTLPGVQQVDDGTGLYVRGGDYTETRVYLNGGRLLNPAQLQNSAGTLRRHTRSVPPRRRVILVRRFWRSLWRCTLETRHHER